MDRDRGIRARGIGLTVGPRLLIWIGAGIVVVTGAFGMATHVWSDYRPEAFADRSGDAESGDTDDRGSGSR